MPADLAAVLLLVLDLVVVALVLAVPLLLLGAVLRRRGGSSPAPVLRRCEACSAGWRAVPGDDHTALGLRLRRRVRRRARARAGPVPRWARPQGWSRCPSCLSKQVRTSRRDGDAAVDHG